VVIEPFHQALSRHDVKLERGRPRTLQINVGSLCNLACKPCHLAAGPGSKETMILETVKHVISYAARCRFETIDLTGGSKKVFKPL
jgi:MoaA/NifB/PqqE/SkfB family radical SAM enzyme